MPILLLVLLLGLSQTRAPLPPPGPDATQEAFIIEQSVTRERYDEDGTGRRLSSARVKIQSDAGVQALGQLAFGYNAGFERLDIEYVRVRKADGTVVTAPPEAVQELTSPVQQQAPVYTDFRQKHVTVPSLRPGETLEYSLVHTIHTPYASGHFWTEHQFERDAIVLDEQLEIDVPASRALTLKLADGAPQPRIAEKDGRRTYHWTSAHTVREKAKDEEALRLEAEAQIDHPRRSSVRLTTFQSWDEVGRWYRGLEEPSRALTPEIRRKAEELTAGRKTDMEKLQALYEFVAPGFRYVSISLGMGRYQPRPAADVLRDQYGDCKDKHTLLAALMEAVGLQASTVLINSAVKIDTDFPSPGQFDHAITHAVVDGRDVWLDVTTEVAPFRLLTANLRKKQALIVGRDGASRLAETPAEPPDGNVVIQEVDGSLGELGTFTGGVRITLRGDAELLMRIVFHRTPAANWKEVVEQLDKVGGIGGEISDWKVSDPAATRTPFEISYKVSKSAWVDWTKKRAALKLPYSTLSLPSVKEPTALSFIDIGGPGRFEARVNLTLGTGYRARAPLPVAIARDYAAYAATYTVEGQRFTAQRRLELKVGALPAERGRDFGAFSRAVTADAEQSLTLEIAPADASVAAPDLKAPDLIRGGYDALRSGNARQAVTLLKRAVELAPKDTKAWKYLGDAHVQLRHYGEALAAYGELLKVNPYDEFAHNSIAYVHWTERRYEEAEASFRKQLELNPLDSYAHASLGRLLVDVERFEAAVPQLEKAISLDRENSDLHVELGTALLELAKDEAALAAFGRAVELAANPLTWNNVAYQLALKGVHLDRALQYAESAVSAAAAVSRNFTVDHVTRRELSVVESLASYWDTLGWVYFARGDLSRAEPLVQAAWLLGYSSEVGDHLAQIYEKQGRKEEAIRMYAIAVNAERPSAETRKRLEALAGAETGALVLRHQSDLLGIRTFPLTTPTGQAGMADFVVLLGGDARPEAVRFVSGEEKLKPLADAIRTLQFGPPLPDVVPARLLRRGTVSCDATGCSFVLFPAHHAQPVQ